jgi:hypothetical protein
MFHTIPIKAGLVLRSFLLHAQPNPLMFFFTDILCRSALFLSWACGLSAKQWRMQISFFKDIKDQSTTTIIYFKFLSKNLQTSFSNTLHCWHAGFIWFDFKIYIPKIGDGVKLLFIFFSFSFFHE